MRKIKSFVALCLAMVMAFSFSAVAFAATPDEHVTEPVVADDAAVVVYQDDEMTVVRTPVGADDDGISPLSTDYNSVWLDSSGSGEFKVYTSNTGTVGITLKVESSSNESFAYISIKKPDGSYFKNKLLIDPTSGNGNGKEYTIFFAKSGSYTIEYTAWTEVGMRIMCWMYK